MESWFRCSRSSHLWSRYVVVCDIVCQIMTSPQRCNSVNNSVPVLSFVLNRLHWSRQWDGVIFGWGNLAARIKGISRSTKSVERFCSTPEPIFVFGSMKRFRDVLGVAIRDGENDIGVWGVSNVAVRKRKKTNKNKQRYRPCCLGVCIEKIGSPTMDLLFFQERPLQLPSTSPHFCWARDKGACLWTYQWEIVSETFYALELWRPDSPYRRWMEFPGHTWTWEGSVGLAWDLRYLHGT